jgi:hypothetical protein
MQIHNVRKSAVTESYEPKQRIVGGIVLSLIMLLIYSILKLLLGFSSAPAGEYILSKPLRDEVSTNMIGTATISGNAKLSRRTSYQLPKKFVFIDLNGNPMQPENFSIPKSKSKSKALSVAGIYNSVDNQGKWYVQAASFKQAQRARRLVQKIKNKKIADTAHIIETNSGWYIVRLSPQNDEKVARQQNRDLRSKLRLKGIVKQVPIK